MTTRGAIWWTRLLHASAALTPPSMPQTAETYAATFDTNVLGTLLSMKHELRVMQPQGLSFDILLIENTSRQFHLSHP
jgi:hypothetical protein